MRGRFIDARILIHGHEVMISKKLDEAAVPDSGCLLKSIERFLKTTNVMRSSDVFKVGWLNHVDFLIKLAMEKHSPHIELREVKVFTLVEINVLNDRLNNDCMSDTIGVQLRNIK